MLKTIRGLLAGGSVVWAASRLRSQVVHRGKSILRVSNVPAVYSSQWRHQKVYGRGRLGVVMFAGLLSFLENKQKEEPESELIMTIKRAILLIQHDEFAPAEQMLHIALKLAQEQQNADGITYVFDLMANLAFAQGQSAKAEKLFVKVMQRVMAKGADQEDLRVNHMSLKLAKIYENQEKFEEAEKGYQFCLNNMEKIAMTRSEDEDAMVLWAMSLDWYARFLLDRRRLSEALICFRKAYDMSLKVNGEIHEQTVVLLNDLGTISFLNGDTNAALDFLNKAVDIGKHLPNMEDFSSIYVNLGNVYLQKNLYVEAKKHCTEGLMNATRHKNGEGIDEARRCLDEVAKVMK